MTVRVHQRALRLQPGHRLYPGGELFVDTPMRFRIRVIRDPCHGHILPVLLGDHAAEFSCTHTLPICDACSPEDLVTGLVTENMYPVSETGHAPPLDTILRHARHVAPDANGHAETKSFVDNSPRSLRWVM